MKAIERPKANPARFTVAKAIYESMREAGVDPPWLSLGGAALDKWVDAAEAALAAMTNSMAIPDWGRIRSSVEDLCDEVGSLRREIRDYEDERA